MKCNFIKTNGEKCRANTTTNSEFCFSHNPDYKEQKAMAVRKGGKSLKRFYLSNQEDITINNANDAKDFLSKLINRVWIGEIPAAQPANTLGFLIRIFLDTLEKAELEERINTIEEKLE